MVLRFIGHIRNAIALDLDVNTDEIIRLTQKFSYELVLLTQFDREWEQQSFDILNKLELLPDETRWGTGLETLFMPSRSTSWQYRNFS